MCVPVHMCPCVSAELPAFEVCLQRRSLAENTGMAICDTIDTWHVNIDNNSVAAPPAGLPFSYLHRLWLRTRLPHPRRNLSLCFFATSTFTSVTASRRLLTALTYFGNFCSVSRCPSLCSQVRPLHVSRIPTEFLNVAYLFL